MLSKVASRHIDAFNPDLPSVLGEMEEGQYLIIIADKKKAVLFLFNKDDMEISKKIMDPGVRKETKINSGEIYGKNTKLEHKMDNQLHQHLQLIMHEIEAFVQGKHINGVFIGGHQPLFHLIEDALPTLLQEKVRGDFVTELNIPEEELLRHCTKVINDYLT